MADVHDDPLREGANAIVGLASELSNVVMATQSLQLRLIGLKPDKDAPLEEVEDLDAIAEISTPQLRAQQASARFAWQPALNDEWLADATPIEAARAWAAAVPFASNEPSAALAMARSEVRLNEIHPEAMANYRELRSQGLSPTDAMLETASLFDTPSLAHQAASEANASTSLAARTSARTALTHDMGLEHSAHLGLENPISLNLHSAPHHTAAAAAHYDEALGTTPKPRPGVLDDDAAEAGAELEDALVTQVPGPAETVLQDDLSLSAGAAPGAAPAADARSTASAGPDPAAPVAAAEPASATDIAMRVFPDAHQAAERTAQLQPVARAQKKKVLSKVLKRRH